MSQFHHPSSVNAFQNRQGSDAHARELHEGDAAPPLHHEQSQRDYLPPRSAPGGEPPRHETAGDVAKRHLDDNQLRGEVATREASRRLESGGLRTMDKIDEKAGAVQARMQPPHDSGAVAAQPGGKKPSAATKIKNGTKSGIASTAGQVQKVARELRSAIRPPRHARRSNMDEDLELQGVNNVNHRGAHTTTGDNAERGPNL